jgi:ABC-type branched-subunit amino acid transport system substrate-binding protein
MRSKVMLALIAVTLVAAAGASARSGDTPGVTATTITIGGTVPLSGIAAAYSAVARGADAYLKYVNAGGGVNGRAIAYKYLDDAYNPAQTVQQTRQLVQQDNIFADFNSLGTEQNIAIREFLNSQKIPQLFVATGASTFGADGKRYPYTIGFQPSYIAEGVIYGKYIVKNLPKAKVAVIFQNDAFGKDLITGLQKGLGKLQIKAKEGYDLTATDVNSQMAKLKASGANTLMIFATPTIAIQSYVAVNKLGWKPKIFVNAVSSASNLMKISTASASAATTEGSISIAVYKDPTNPKFAKDAAMKQYRALMAKYGSGDVNDVYNVYGMAVAYTLVDVLERAGKNLTRDGALTAALHLNLPSNPFLLPGIRVRTTPNDRFPITQAYLQQWHSGSWRLISPILSARG